MSHLGERVGALVDGRLSADAEGRALAHAARCAACARALDAERRVKAQLTSLPPPPPGPDLVNALLDLAAPGGPVPPRRARVPGEPRVAPIRAPGRPAGRSRESPGRSRAGSPTVRPGSRRPAVRGWRTTRAAVGVLGVMCVVGVGLGAAALAPREGTTVRPVDTFSVTRFGGGVEVTPAGRTLPAMRSPGRASDGAPTTSDGGR